MKTLHRVTADGTYVEASTQESVEAAKSAMNRKLRRGATLSSPKGVGDFLAARLASLEHGVFGVALVDKRNRLIEFVELLRGTIHGSSVHPRELVKLALAKNAAVLVLVHPHPSVVCEPSRADGAITKRLVDIRVLDHIIIAGGDSVSLAERGLL
jgi:DNA repair protein RadC